MKVILTTSNEENVKRNYLSQRCESETISSSPDHLTLSQRTTGLPGVALYVWCLKIRKYPKTKGIVFSPKGGGIN
ncbi:hypothetical protein chiPu_0004290 [Chiloscyllium punctatum]|uniref:Uncharacterized protein n=1 Tax=Chiloscyllium punctatum TaxID=137246 RepID=A0A401S671_CHIPU|nr:hypothetical protein [Chiloscyllium punctatum]